MKPDALTCGEVLALYGRDPARAWTELAARVSWIARSHSPQDCDPEDTARETLLRAFAREAEALRDADIEVSADFLLRAIFGAVVRDTARSNAASFTP